MDELLELYQELILDHGKSPRNFRSVDAANHRADGHNPLCGDRLTLMLRVRDNIVEDVGFQGSGCAISTAAASTMTEAIRGKPLSEVESMFERFHDLVTGQPTDSDKLPPKLLAFQGVSAYPMRVKCATLAWHTLHNALAKEQVVASTE